MKSNWIYYALVLLTIEKMIQHIVVTLAFYFNWRDIASTVVVAPVILMISGAVLAILWAVSLLGLLKKRAWVVDLLLFLSIFDIVGEFVAQGTPMIMLTVSFLVAVVLLILSLTFRRQMHTG
jgi:hypothetical protein